MFNYIIRRLLLMIPTFLGITLIFFVILQIVPGGPLEREIMKIRMARMMGGGKGAATSQVGDNRDTIISPEAMEKMKKFYGFDKPIMVRYLLWLGLWPRNYNEKELDIGQAFRYSLRYVPKGYDIFEVQKWLKVEMVNGKLTVLESPVGGDFQFDIYPELPDADEILPQEWQPAAKWRVAKISANSVRVYQTKFSGVFTGDLGDSYEYKEPVIKLVIDRLHISLYFGIIGFLLSYCISIPLGIHKAIKHGSIFDMGSSALVFIGYSIPSFALGALLLMWFGGGSFWDIFPLGGFRSENFADLSFWGKIWDQLHHTILPVFCEAIGSFAGITMLMKNSLMENLGKDYVRTAFAKGLSEKRVVFVHAMRNSLIPLATGIGGLIGLFLTGSYLLEKVFNINGIGLLGYVSLINRDYPVSLGFMVLGSVVMLLGNLISDLTYAAIDPRIRFK
ncbi:MAG TPA: ABC transporter permease subunit [Candidatus Cloacimonadota bacterium]|nr:ABC transporter permease subunit [Candidatus Cloacimonadota bacterium]